MKEIKRYACDVYYDRGMYDHSDGDFVSHDDHAAIVAALQEQVRELAFRSNGMTDEDKQQIVEEYNAAMCASNEAGYAGITAAETIRYLIQRAEAAEEEIARRDAAASEPVGYGFQHKETGKFGTVMMPKSLANDCEVYSAVPLYTAAPPAVLPELEQDVKNIIGLLAENEWAEHCTKSELGRDLECEITRLQDLRAQPQKPVELPGYLSYAGIPAEYPSYAEEIAHQRGFEHGVKRCKESLDAANVKYEVKK